MDTESFESNWAQKVVFYQQDLDAMHATGTRSAVRAWHTHQIALDLGLERCFLCGHCGAEYPSAALDDGHPMGPCGPGKGVGGGTVSVDTWGEVPLGETYCTG
jgi:hypothetical protein